MTRIFLLVLAFAVCAAGCGDEDDPPAARPNSPATVAKSAYVARVDDACRRAIERRKDPVAVARALPESPIQTSAEGEAKRTAERWRGYRAIVQDVIDTVRGRAQPEGGRGAAEEYAVELSKAATEMENEELILRQGWDRQSFAPAVRRHLRTARRLARRYGFEDCARF